MHLGIELHGVALIIDGILIYDVILFLVMFYL
jgi:hypothetical protein